MPSSHLPPHIWAIPRNPQRNKDHHIAFKQSRQNLFQYIYLQLIWIRRHHLSVSVNLVFAEETLSVQHLVSTTSDEVFSIKQPVFQYYSVYPPGVCVRKPMCLFWWVERAWKSLRGVSSLRIWRSGCLWREHCRRAPKPGGRSAPRSCRAPTAASVGKLWCWPCDPWLYLKNTGKFDCCLCCGESYSRSISWTKEPL